MPSKLPDSSLRRQVEVSRSRGGLLLPEVNGLVPWLLANVACLARAGDSALIVDLPGGQGTGAAEPDQLQPGRALDSLSIRA